MQNITNTQTTTETTMPREISPDGSILYESFTYHPAWSNAYIGEGQQARSAHTQVVTLNSVIDSADKSLWLQVAIFTGEKIGDSPLSPGMYRGSIMLQAMGKNGLSSMSLSWSAAEALVQAIAEWKRQHPDLDNPDMADEMMSDDIPF